MPTKILNRRRYVIKMLRIKEIDCVTLVLDRLVYVIKC